MASTTGGTLDPARNGGPKLRLLGQVELHGPVTLRFLPERRFRLLAYLALQGKWVARDQLAHAFWPDRTQDASRTNLRKVLAEVRALGVPALEDSRHSLRWLVEHDVTEFARAHAENDHAAVLRLYGGTPLDGLDGSDNPSFATWLRRERLRLRTMWRESVLATVRDVAPQAAVNLSQRLLDDDPYDEEAVRLQMGALAALGRVTDVARTYRRFAERVTEELGVDVAIETRNLAHELQNETPSPPVLATKPIETSEGFIGRDAELAELQALLADPECRLITVTGPGGMGKSRLVKELIHRLPLRAGEPVVWMALDDLTDIAQVAPRLVRELGLAAAPLQDAVDVVAKHLAPLKATLVFDNSEHLPSLKNLIERWLAVAPQLKIVATSRARIGVRSEWLVTLQGLNTPPADAGDDVFSSDAARLFVTYARLTQPRFDAPSNARNVAALVRAVGGMPLAILLAAGWVRVLPVADMVSDLTHLLHVLERVEEGDERPEHRSVRATFEQSWRLLAPAEQHLLMMLSVFAGTFTRTAVHDVSLAPLPVLGSLIDKSLVQIDGSARCSLHPLIQQFAAQKLDAEPAQRVAIRDQHAASYARMMEQYGRFDSTDQPAAFRTIATELSNILVAWEWAIVQKRADWLSHCASGLSNYFQARGPLGVGVDLFARAEAALAGSHPASSDAAWIVPLEYASLNYWSGKYREVEAGGRRALTAARERGNGYAIRTSLNTVGLALFRQGRLTEADRYISEALKRARAEHLSGEVASFAGNLVSIKRELGDTDGAVALVEEALDGHRKNGHQIGQISMYTELGLILHATGKLGPAIEAYESGLRLAEASDLDSRRSALLTYCASALLDRGDINRARELSLEALRIVLATDLVSKEPMCRCTLAAIEVAAGNADAAREQLIASIPVTRKIATVPAIVLVLRDGANFLEKVGDPVTALRLIACADVHLVSRMVLIARYRDTADRLRIRLDASSVAAAEAAGAALSLDAGLDELSRALDERSRASFAVAAVAAAPSPS